MRLSILVFAVLALLLLSSNVLASVVVSPMVKQATVSRNDSIGLQFRLKNTGFEEECVDLWAEVLDFDQEAYIEASLSRESLCLNESESTNITLTIRTENAPKGLYEILLEAVSDQDTAAAEISIFVGGEPEIELVAFPNDLCRGRQETVNVLVRNNSDEFKQVELQAENEMLLPYFEKSSISLMPLQERYVELRVHPSPFSAVGRQYVSMFAVSDYEAVKERIAIDVEDCDPEEKADFSVRVSERCFIVEKGVDERIYFEVRNKEEEEQKVYFSVGGDLTARLETGSAWLEENEEREFYFDVKLANNARVKDYNVVLNVWNSRHSVEKQLCVKPEKEHSTNARLEENYLRVRQCESIVFTLILENLGDYTEDFYLSLENPYSEIEAELSEEDHSIERYDKKRVYVNVNALPDSVEGSYTISLEIETDDETFEKELNFKVLKKEHEEPATGGLSITAYASTVKIALDDKKPFIVSVKNNSADEMENISISLTGLPESASATAENGISLQPGQEKSFELEVLTENTPEGEHSLVLETENPDYRSTRPVKLFVEEKAGEGNGFFAGLTGLFAAGGSALLGLAALAIIIIFFAFIAKALRRPNTPIQNGFRMGGN